MSKNNFKNLSYTAELPPFLARLRGQAGPKHGDGPDPILAARRRPTGKKRSASEEAEDAPLVVDEDGNVVETTEVSADGDVAIVKGSEKSPEKKDESGDVDKTPSQEVAAIGTGKKRRAAKVIGDDETEDKPTDSSTKSTNNKPSKPKKKAKKIKLSFDEE